jgi:hypothetical protein
MRRGEVLAVSGRGGSTASLEGVWFAAQPLGGGKVTSEARASPEEHPLLGALSGRAKWGGVLGSLSRWGHAVLSGLASRIVFGRNAEWVRESVRGRPSGRRRARLRARGATLFGVKLGRVHSSVAESFRGTFGFSGFARSSTAGLRTPRGPRFEPGGAMGLRIDRIGRIGARSSRGSRFVDGGADELTRCAPSGAGREGSRRDVTSSGARGVRGSGRTGAMLSRGQGRWRLGGWFVGGSEVEVSV